MKKLLLSFLFIGCLGANAQTTLFEDHFDTYDDFLITGFGGWSTLDIDLLNTYVGGQTGPATWANAGDPQAFQIFNPTTAMVTNLTSATDENRNFDPRSGAKYAASWAGVPDISAPGNEDWLISPPITLGSSGNELSVWVKSMSDTYGLENYSIGVYVGSGEPALSSDFVLTAANTLEAPYAIWENITVDLNDYSGQTIRIGIRNEGSDHYMLMVDDFKVTTTGLGINEAFAKKFNTYPNPATNVVTISNNDNILLTNVAINDINGRTIKTVAVSNLSEVELNVSDLSAGVYFMNVSTDSGIAVKKFIKN